MEGNVEVTELGRFLQEELTVSAAEIDLIMQKAELNAPIPMLLWQYGLVTCHQLNCLFDWLDERPRLTLLDD